MIIVSLSGGLGNQMFQYALGRCLAEKRQDTLILYTGSLEESRSPWSYGLRPFLPDATLVNEHRVLRKMGGELLWTAEALNSRFCSAVFAAPPGNIMLRGKWQSENYFNDIANTVRAVFRFDAITLKDDYTVLARQIETTSSVCVHVRRGDYLSPRRDKEFTGAVYYASAVRKMREKCRDPHFFIFSDDIAWCIETLSFDDPHTFVPCTPWPEDCAAEHMYLMNLCRHFIIANSAFSWWGAWLGNSRDKIVIAPRRWFKDDLNSGSSLSEALPAAIAPAAWNRL